MSNSDLAEEINKYTLIQFDKIKDKLNLSYDDYKGFIFGYTIGIMGALKTLKCH